MEKKKLAHVAIIMDGNGRWAKSKHLPRVMGHHAGVRAVERTVRAAKDLDIPYISLYAFSTENWKRPKGEVLGLMGLFRYYMNSKLNELCREKTRMRFAGDLAALPEDIRQILRRAEEKTEQYEERQLIICLNYGGRKEIIDAINKITAQNPQSPVTEEMLRENLYLPDVPDPDLIIRTSGELRLSNFWLWQSSYSEYYFTDKYWPDFNKEDLEEAVKDYYERERRYGKA
ncbi:polyprenyl diphosphate synthase [Cloacibacillus evryensis]|uniref:Isoprenyl transferase n=2 Tax=root TaxID=1 RepID=A0AAW5K575_9BACT|nr:polyprenyl diphosphate synthase [Cloacibacillus evryensis]EHL65218.1 di-trans,poly-cis-decaprenylcistransferase [Synergistes sp. 3_1_syn1]MCQ4763014.1 polyprenyl diphosphate synthase [Cloacibacillus evryensis]MCQ4814315.1 polyprenyl diphosphate synthase [Cloacibacillus evryensis]MEA5034279.1 polyprenyl diphosphate synthase [Cloacibacillus evryensis]